MSATSSDNAVLSELIELLGGSVEPVQHDPQSRAHLEALVLADRFRTLIKKAMREDDVSVRALAARLGVSPSVVSRRLTSDGDMKIWTAAAIADALGRAFHVDLRATRSPHAHSNHSSPSTHSAHQQQANSTYDASPPPVMKRTSAGNARLQVAPA
jgi:hypothetical protein